MTIKVITIISIFGVLFGVTTAFAQSAILYFVPGTSNVTPGQTFRVTIMVDTKAENVNAVAAYFTYAADKLDVVAVDKTGSAMTLFAEDKVGAGRGTISGGTPTPGFSGVQKIASVDFRVKPTATGSMQLTFATDAAVLRNSDNKNILSLGSSGNAQFQVVQTTPPPPPPQPPQTPPPPPPPPPPPQTPPQTPPPPPPSEISISEIQLTPVGNTDVQVSWKTSEPTSATLYYGTQGEPYPFSILDAELTDTHSVVLFGVDIADQYFFEISGESESGGKAKTEQLALQEFIQESPRPSPPSQQEEGFRVPGLDFRFPSLVLFVLLPIGVMLLVGFILFWRMRARV